MSFRVVLAFGLLCGTVLALGQGRAAACSCGFGPVEDLLAEADGAFIGSLVEVGERTNDGRDIPYTFEVTEWIKGDRDPGAFDVYSGPDGGACGFEAPFGQEVAVFVWVQGDRATGGLCSTMDAGSVRATLRPPTVGEGPGHFLATSWSGPSYVLNADGGVVAAHPAGVDAPRASLRTTCGGSVVAELRHDEVALVDTATFEDIESLQFRRSTRQLVCEGDRIYADAGPRDAPRVYDIRTRQPVSAVLAGRAGVAVVGDELIYRAEADSTYPEGWRALNLETGAERFIVEMSTTGRRMESVDFSPDGTRIALTLAEGNQAVLDLVIVRTDNGQVVTRSLATHVASVRWLDDAQIFVATSSGGFPGTENSLVVDGDDLTTIAAFDSDLVWPTHLQDGNLIGFEGGTLQSRPVSGGSLTTVNELPGPHVLLRLPEPAQMATTGSAAQAPIDTPISSPVIEAIPPVRESGAESAVTPTPTEGATPTQSPAPSPPPLSDDLEQAQPPIEPSASSSSTLLTLAIVGMLVVGATTGVVIVRRRHG